VELVLSSEEVACLGSTVDGDGARIVAVELASERKRRGLILPSVAVVLKLFRDIELFSEVDIGSLHRIGLWLATKLRALVVDRLDYEQTTEWRIMLS